MPRIEVEILEKIRDRSSDWDSLGIKEPPPKEIWIRYYISTEDIQYVKASKVKNKCYIKCSWMEEAAIINDTYDDFTITLHDAEELENEENTEEE